MTKKLSPAGFIIRIFSFFFLLAGLPAAEPMSPPPGGQPLFPDGMNRFQLFDSAGVGSRREVRVSGPFFDQAIEIETRVRPDHPWRFQFGSPLPEALRQGDVLWISFWMRATRTSTESSSAFAQLCVEQSSEPYEKLGTFDFAVGSEWRQIARSIVADRNYAAGEAQLLLRLGYSPQTVQIGGWQALNFGRAVRPEELPRTVLTWSGRGADAPWREEAARRIETHRKAELRIRVKDAAGRPVPAAEVRLRQTRHHFGFGSAVTAAWLTGSGPDHDRYREIVKTSYSKVVLENDLKWPVWERSARDGHRTTLKALHWLRDQQIAVRGHVLVWPSWKYSPESLRAVESQPPELARKIGEHIDDSLGTTRGLCSEWDVVNEPYHNHDLLDILPAGSMASWFRRARQADPQAKLYLNDFAGFMENGENTAHKDAFERTLRELKKQGAPIDGLGIQAHFDQQLTGPEELLRELDRWAQLGLDIQITEFDLNLDEADAAVQAEYTRDFLTAVFSHPSVSAILMWGFWEGAHWQPKAALYRKDWSIKPNGQAWNDLVLKEWRTDLAIPTDARGEAVTRAFKGDYEITVSRNGATKTQSLTLTSDRTLEITLP